MKNIIRRKNGIRRSTMTMRWSGPFMAWLLGSLGGCAGPHRSPECSRLQARKS
jgi:hypothetical protein